MDKQLSLLYGWHLLNAMLPQVSIINP